MGRTPDSGCQLRLFVSGSGLRSSQNALSNLGAFCDEELAGRYDLEVIDLLERPELAEEFQILATPTLVKVLPLPACKLIGDLSARERLRAALGVASEPRPIAAAAEEGGIHEPILALSPDGIVMVDTAGRVLYVNPAAERMFGRDLRMDKDAIFGSPLVDGETTEIDLVNGGVAELRTVAGTWRGAPAYVVALHDITARERAERALRELNQRLREVNESKSRIVASTSHELRTPLTAMNNYLQLLDEEIYGPLNDRQREAIAGLFHCLRSELRMVNDLLDLARIESGQLSVVIESVELAELCARLVETSGATSAAGVVVELELDAALPAQVQTDGQRLEQILSNLLTNALKFTTRGRVALRGALDAEGRVTLAVSDTGIGIPAERYEAIFEPFCQLEVGGAHQAQGAGLGLHIARQLAELLGARIDVRSVPGEGSVFTVTLGAEGTKPA